jgi:hypothetical protein
MAETKRECVRTTVENNHAAGNSVQANAPIAGRDVINGPVFIGESLRIGKKNLFAEMYSLKLIVRHWSVNVESTAIHKAKINKLPAFLQDKLVAPLLGSGALESELADPRDAGNITSASNIIEGPKNTQPSTNAPYRISVAQNIAQDPPIANEVSYLLI